MMLIIAKNGIDGGDVNDYSYTGLTWIMVITGLMGSDQMICGADSVVKEVVSRDEYCFWGSVLSVRTLMLFYKYTEGGRLYKVVVTLFLDFLW